MEENHSLKLKVILIGEMAVGKTSLVSRFLDNSFEDMYLATIGVDFRVRTFQIDGTTVKLNIWDTAGQERFKSLVPTYFRNVHGALVVFDVTDLGSFNTVKVWLCEIEKQAGKVPVIIVANKCDIPEHERKVSKSQISKLKREFHLPLRLVSAKSGDGVKELFEELTRMAVSEKLNSMKDEKTTFTHHQLIPEISKSPPEQKKCPC